MDINALRLAVTAKQAYWDSALALEKTFEGELSDDQCNRLAEAIDQLAAGGDAHAIAEAEANWLESFVKGV